MTLKVEILSALTDNYIYILHDEESGETAAIDPSEAAPVLKFLDQRSWKLDFILNTHHHHDHVGGNLELKDATGCKIFGSKKDSHQIPGIDFELSDNDEVKIGLSTARVIAVPGHTLGHINYFFSCEEFLFSGDTLFSLGCGRLFEGTPEMMFSTLQKLKNLPQTTKVFCGHEYTEKNCQFALSLEPHNHELKNFLVWVKDKRIQNLPSVPSSIGLERKLNPFFKAKDAADFAKIRALRNNF